MLSLRAIGSWCILKGALQEPVGAEDSLKEAGAAGLLQASSPEHLVSPSAARVCDCAPVEWK